MAGHDAVTLLRVKTFEKEGERWLEGIATTPDLDRVGDSVNPEGAVYALPLPLLWQHKHDEPIGSVTEVRVTKAGIRVRARISVGVAKADEIWTLIRDGVLNACSIGFRALKSVPLKNGGRRYDEWELLELSIVSVPAHPGAKISIAKCMAMKASDLRPVSVALPQPFGYQKGMTQGGVDLDQVFAEIRTRAQELGMDAATAKDDHLPYLAYGIAEFGKLASRKALAMVKDLEERIARIEEKGVVYRGHFNASDEYTRGDLVTHGGSIFHATRDTYGLAPTHGGDERKELDHPWQLAVRRGRDAKGGDR